jgi:hypothetical protein
VGIGKEKRKEEVVQGQQDKLMVPTITSHCWAASVNSVYDSENVVRTKKVMVSGGMNERRREDW